MKRHIFQVVESETRIFLFDNKKKQENCKTEALPVKIKSLYSEIRVRKLALLRLNRCTLLHIVYPSLLHLNIDSFAFHLVFSHFAFIFTLIDHFIFFILATVSINCAS